MIAYDHATKFQVTTNPSRAREILEKRIEEGRKSAVSLFERLHTDLPRDDIKRGQAVHFGTKDFSGSHEALFPELVMGYAEKEATIHKHALGQLAQRAGVPGAYLAELANGTEWQRKLAAGILNTHYHEGTPDSRYLIRAVRDEVRGFLSDRFRRLDNRPLAETLIDEARTLGALPIDGTGSDTRVSMKIILPQIFEPVPGEVIAFGLEWSNSDFGAALHAIRAFVLRVWCLNGATMENSLAQVHLGRQLGDDIELSRETYELDTKTSVSALRDVVRGTLAPKKVEALCAGIQRANENKVDWKNVQTGLAKKLLKSEMEAARHSFESDDEINLPAGNTMWRVSNSISWLAGKTTDPDRKLELQRLAGELVDGKADVKLAA